MNAENAGKFILPSQVICTLFLATALAVRAAKAVAPNLVTILTRCVVKTKTVGNIIFPGNALCA